MKTFYRVVSGAAVICIGLGLLLGGVGVMLGGRLSQLPDSGLRLAGWVTPTLWGYETVEADYAGRDIRKLDFELEAMDVEIQEGDTFSVRADQVDSRRFTTRVEGDTWKIDCDNQYFGRRPSRFGGRWDRRAPHVTITLPKGYMAEELDLEMGMGNLFASNLSARRSELSVGMGNMTLENFTSGDCDIEVGMGDLIILGSVTGRGAIDCGMGDLEMHLAGPQRDYGCNVSVGMGSVTVGDETIGGLSGERSFNAGAKNFFEIDCGMGNVEIYFDE